MRPPLLHTTKTTCRCWYHSPLNQTWSLSEIVRVHSLSSLDNEIWTFHISYISFNLSVCCLITFLYQSFTKTTFFQNSSCLVWIIIVTRASAFVLRVKPLGSTWMQSTPCLWLGLYLASMHLSLWFEQNTEDPRCSDYSLNHAQKKQIISHNIWIAQVFHRASFVTCPPRITKNKNRHHCDHHTEPCEMSLY